MYNWRFNIFITIFISSVFCGYFVKIGDIFLQSSLLVLIVLTNLDILVRSIKSLFAKYYIVIWLLVSAFILSSISSLDFLLHIRESIRFFVVISVGLVLSFYARLFPLRLAKILSLTIVSVSILSFLVYVGVNFYPVVGERFGFPRPFLFANPITLSILLGSSICYIYSQYKPRMTAVFSFFGLMSFWSYTGLVVYFIVRHKVALMFFIFIISVFLISSVEVGSFLIRARIMLDALESINYLEIEQLLFGVGFRNLDLWNDLHGHLLLTTDITFFIRVIYEFGLLGFFSFSLAIVRIFVRDFTLGLVLMFLFLSIDQVAHLWVLPFLILLSKDKLFNASKTGFKNPQSVR